MVISRVVFAVPHVYSRCRRVWTLLHFMRKARTGVGHERFFGFIIVQLHPVVLVLVLFYPIFLLNLRVKPLIIGALYMWSNTFNYVENFFKNLCIHPPEFIEMPKTSKIS